MRWLFILSLWSPNVSVTQVTGTIPIFYLGAPVLDGSLEAAGFVSVLWRQRQVDKSQRDVMTPPSMTKSHRCLCMLQKVHLILMTAEL